ncbi:hypothetical protein TNCV_3372741 [Trichonephila clavipes]|nr:hypothetical protein TNCV_3372741 [Trichonephila clavipes]
MGRGGLMVVKGTEQQKFFLELGVVAMSLETLPEFNAIYDGTFPISLHEETENREAVPPFFFGSIHTPRLEPVNLPFSPRCITVNRHQDWNPSHLDASL